MFHQESSQCTGCVLTGPGDMLTFSVCAACILIDATTSRNTLWAYHFVCVCGSFSQTTTFFGFVKAKTGPAIDQLILKTIGNRKGDCAWSCSRWQTQPEKICKSQRTNQCHSLRTLYWFVLCNLQIFSGCVCHLEQLHAQSPFLFPIVFSINLIPFFDICSVDLLAVFQPGCSGICYFTWAAARSQQLLFVVLAAGLWCLTAGCHVKSPLFPQPPLKQKCAPRSRWRKHTWESIHTSTSSKTVVFFTIQRSPRISTSYQFAAPRYRLPCRLYRWASNLTFQRHGKIAQSCRNHNAPLAIR